MQHNETPPHSLNAPLLLRKGCYCQILALCVCMLWCWRRLRRRQDPSGSSCSSAAWSLLDSSRVRPSPPHGEIIHSWCWRSASREDCSSGHIDDFAWNIAALDWAIFLLKAREWFSVSDLSPETCIHCPRKVTAERLPSDMRKRAKRVKSLWPGARGNTGFRWEQVWYLKSEVNHRGRVGPRLPFLHFSILSPTSLSAVSLVTTWNHTRPEIGVLGFNLPPLHPCESFKFRPTRLNLIWSEGQSKQKPSSPRWHVASSGDKRRGWPAPVL